MSFLRGRLRRRPTFLAPCLMFLAFTFMLLSPVVDAAAQGLQISANPTATPSPTPTETFDPPLQANPTEAPPTKEVPPQETEEDELVIATEEPDAPSNSITIHKITCDEPGFDFHSPEMTSNIGNYTDHESCGAPDGEFEFTVSDGEGFTETAMTSVGSVQFDVPTGGFSIVETVPAGWAEPVAYCWSNLVASADGIATVGNSKNWTIADGEHAECLFVNITLPEEPTGHTIRVAKYTCPEGFDRTSDWFTYQSTCITPMPGVNFTLDVEGTTDTGATGGTGVIEWTGVQLGPTGQIGIDEEIPAGYGEPVVWCVSYPEAGADPEDFDVYLVPSSDGAVAVTPEQHHPFIFSCIYFNFPADSGDLTILKWTCPEGYDLFAAGADPKMDCTEATNGVQFQFGPDGGNALAHVQTTGDIIDGGVYFGDLEPGTYKAVETVPDGIESVFVLECTGHLMGVLQPYPLREGSVLDSIEIDAGEHLTCHWFNVPASDGGTLTVIKYTCSTEVYVSEVDCEIEENGVGFDLEQWNVGTGAWDVIDSQVTDGFGRIVWAGLDQGDYRLDEHGGDWCHLQTTPVFGPGDGFSLFEGEDTVVEVFNCTGEPGEPGDTPTKYPNTGVQPDASEGSAEKILPGYGSMLGLLPLLMMDRSQLPLTSALNA